MLRSVAINRLGFKRITKFVADVHVLSAVTQEHCHLVGGSSVEKLDCQLVGGRSL